MGLNRGRAFITHIIQGFNYFRVKAKFRKSHGNGLISRNFFCIGWGGQICLSDYMCGDNNAPFRFVEHSFYLGAAYRLILKRSSKSACLTTLYDTGFNRYQASYDICGDAYRLWLDYICLSTRSDGIPILGFHLQYRPF